MSFVEVCPEIPVNGVCPVPMEWVEHAEAALSLGGFLEMLPYLFVTAFGVWGGRKLIYVLSPAISRS